MGNNAFGSGPYKRALHTARRNNEAGTQHHLHDKHYKEWLKSQPPDEKNKAVASNQKQDTQKAALPKVLSKEKAKAATQKLKAITASVAVVPITKTKEMVKKERDERLKEKYRQMQREKFVNSFKSHCRCDDIKSVGNGL